MSSTTKKHLWAIALTTAIISLIYSNSLHCSFHFDDQTSIIENQAIQDFNLKEILQTSRPVLELTLALNYYFNKLNVSGYHIVNICLHIANSIILYFILFLTANLPAVKDKYGVRAFRIALYSALIFAVHPVQTQAVTYIISRSSVLATTFYLLTLLFFIKATSHEQGKESRGLKTHRQRPNPHNSKLYLFAAALSASLGMGTKQIAATIPAMLLIYDLSFISAGSFKELRRHWKIHILMFSTLTVALYLNSSLLGEFISFDYGKGGVQIPHAAPISSFEYFLTQLHVIPYYIKLLFIPTNLNFDYDWPVTHSIDLLTTGFFILLAGIISYGIAIFRRKPLLSFAIIWFFVTLSVTSGIVVIYDMIFEHRLYLPSVGFAIMGGVMISGISGAQVRGKVDR